jgi:hypothetical protein
MPSSYTESLRLIKPVTGELIGTWGDSINAGLTELVEDAIAGTVSVAMANANVTLTAVNEAADQSRNMFITLTGANTAQRDVVVPTVSKLFFVGNATTGGFGVQVKTAAGTGFVVPNGQRMALYCDGTNVISAFGSTTGLALLVAADAAAARNTLGGTTIGNALFVAASAAAARTALGFTAVGSALATAASTDAAQTAIGATATGKSLITAADLTALKAAVGVTDLPGPLLYCNSAYAAFGTGVLTTVKFSTVVIDTDAGYSAGTGKYTVPVSGYYELQAAVVISVNTAAYITTASIGCYKNGSTQLTYQEQVAHPLSTAVDLRTVLPITVFADLTAGDTLEIKVYLQVNNGAGGTTDFVYTTGSTLSIKFLGA